MNGFGFFSIDSDKDFKESKDFKEFNGKWACIKKPILFYGTGF